MELFFLASQFMQIDQFRKEKKKESELDQRRRVQPVRNASPIENGDFF